MKRPLNFIEVAFLTEVRKAIEFIATWKLSGEIDVDERDDEYDGLVDTLIRTARALRDREQAKMKSAR